MRGMTEPEVFVLADRAMEEAGREKFDGDLLGDDPKRSFARHRRGRLRRGDRGRCPRSRGALLLRRLPGTPLLLADHPVPRPAGPRHRPGDRRAPDLPEEPVEGIWAQISPHAEQWREIGVFPPAVEVAPDAPLLDRLLGLTGRDPAA